MSEKRIVVPEGMLKAAIGREHVRASLEAALLWLSENPIVPTEQQAQSVADYKSRFPFDPFEWVRWGAVEWQRRMFLAPEPEVPEEVKDLLVTVESIQGGGAQSIAGAVKELNERTIEAFNRGKKSGSK